MNPLNHPAIVGIGNLLTFLFDASAREERRTRAALRAARAYIAVDRRESPYDKLTDKKRNEYKLHFLKQVKAWS